MGREGGYIKLHRKILDWEWYGDTNTKVIFLHLILTANYKPLKWRGHQIDRGERAVSLNTLSCETGLSIQSVRTAISHLKRTGEVTSRKIPECTIFSVKNYENFQNVADGTTKQSDNPQQAAGNPPANGQPVEKKGKKGRKEEENKRAPSLFFQTETRPEIRSHEEFPPEIKSALERWRLYKKERGEAYHAAGWNRFRSAVKHKLEQYPEREVIALLDDARANHWKGIPWDRLDRKKGQEKESRWREL